MTESERIAIIQDHARGLRSEIEKNAESQRALFRLAIIGMAAIFALRKDIALDDLQPLLPLIPIIGIGLFGYWAAENTLILRMGRSLAESEIRINRIAGEELITYEQNFWQWRKHHLNRSCSFFVICALIVSTGYFWLFHNLLRHSDLQQYHGFEVLMLVGAVATYFIALLYSWRIVSELKTPLNTSGHGSSAGGPRRGTAST